MFRYGVTMRRGLCRWILLHAAALGTSTRFLGVGDLHFWEVKEFTQFWEVKDSPKCGQVNIPQNHNPPMASSILVPFPEAVRPVRPTMSESQNSVLSICRNAPPDHVAPIAVRSGRDQPD